MYILLIIMSILNIIINAIPQILSVQSLVDVLSCIFYNEIEDENNNNNIINDNDNKILYKSPSLKNLNNINENNILPTKNNQIMTNIISRTQYKQQDTSIVIFMPLITVCYKCKRNFTNYIYCANDNYYCSDYCRKIDINKSYY